MTEQQKFEAHMREQFGWEDCDFKCDSFGYRDSSTAAAWQAWQARAAQDKSAGLLEALIGLVGCIDHGSDNPSSKLDTARAAISKARGTE